MTERRNSPASQGTLLVVFKPAIVCTKPHRTLLVVVAYELKVLKSVQRQRGGWRNQNGLPGACPPPLATRFFRQARIKLFDKLRFVIGGVVAGEETVQRFFVQSLPRYFFASGNDGIEQRMVRLRGFVVPAHSEMSSRRSCTSLISRSLSGVCSSRWRNAAGVTRRF